MSALDIEPTERLTYSMCCSEDIEGVFKSIETLPTLPADYDTLSNKDRLKILEKHSKRLNDSIDFIVERICPKEVDGHQCIKVYAYDEMKQPIGRAVINYFNTARPSLEIRVLPEKQNQGYGFEMLKAVIKAAFNQFDYDHLEYDLLAFNDASRKIVLKLGGRLVYKDHRGESYVIDRDNESHK